MTSTIPYRSCNDGKRYADQEEGCTKCITVDSHLGDIHPASHQELYDAEEEEAYDSHDLADAGTEAAAMERYV